MTVRLRLHNPGLLWTASRPGRAGSRVVQWPPSPWMLLSALVAGAHAMSSPGPACAAIETLAAGDDPSMWLPGLHEHPMRWCVWVGKTGPQDAAEHWGLVDASRGVSGMSDQRTKHRWFTVRGEWRHPCAFVDFPVVLEPDLLSALAAAARSTPYVGRATDEVSIGVLTPAVNGRGWCDHTAGDGVGDRELTEPGPGHEWWRPVSNDQQNRPVPGGRLVRVATADLVSVLDLSHDRRHRLGLPGVRDQAMGRTITYAPGSRDPSSGPATTTDTPATRSGGPAWGAGPRVVLRLAGRRRDAEVLAALNGTPFLLGGGRPWAVSFSSRDEAVAAVAARPELFADGQPHRRHVEVFHGTPHRAWRSAAPLVAHPDRRIATHEICSELADAGFQQPRVELSRLGACPQLPQWSLWLVRLLLDLASPGPIQLGQGKEFGYGRFRKQEG